MSLKIKTENHKIISAGSPQKLPRTCLKAKNSAVGGFFFPNDRTIIDICCIFLMLVKDIAAMISDDAFSIIIRSHANR